MVRHVRHLVPTRERWHDLARVMLSLSKHVAAAAAV
jgi:hypothetical protein